MVNKVKIICLEDKGQCKDANEKNDQSWTRSRHVYVSKPTPNTREAGDIAENVGRYKLLVDGLANQAR